jgi:hypothetical protein
MIFTFFVLLSLYVFWNATVIQYLILIRSYSLLKMIKNVSFYLYLKTGSKLVSIKLCYYILLLATLIHIFSCWWLSYFLKTDSVSENDSIQLYDYNNATLLDSYANSLRFTFGLFVRSHNFGTRK